ncbi:MAG: MATE family efflux transporter [Planctomycetes bacterium]|nr:MATE family efflux transporter [Planctomycetota bacterium]
MTDTTARLAARQGTWRPLLRLAMPVMAEEFLNLLVGYTDWWLTGKFLGTTEHQAAMGLIAYVLWLLPSMFSAAVIGATALIARLVGAGDLPGARRVMHQAFLVGAVLAALATAGVAFGGETFVRWMRLDASAVPLAMEYIAVLAWIVPAIMAEQVAIASLRGAGDTRTGLLAKVAVNVVNTLLCTLLVTGSCGVPKLGWKGLAIGASVGHLVGAVVLILVLLRGRAGLRFEWRELRPIASIIRRLLRVGVPGGMDVLAVVGCHLTYFAIINTLGKEATAGHGLGVQIESLAYCPGSAFQVAIATLAGQLLGAGRADEAARTVRRTSLAAVAFYSAAGAVFYFGGLPLARLFTAASNDRAAELAALYLSIVAISMPSLALVVVFSGALRGVGDTVWPLAVTFLGLAILRIPGACWLAWDECTISFLDLRIPGWGLGVIGAWYAMVFDVFVRSGLFLGRIVHGGWKRTIV